MDFTLVGSLITDCLPKQSCDLGDSDERIAQVVLEAVEVVDGGFNRWLAVRGNRTVVAVVSVSWNRVGSVDVMDTIASLSTTVNLIEHFLKIFFGAPGLIYPECFKKVNFLTVVPTEHVFVSRHGALM